MADPEPHDRPTAFARVLEGLLRPLVRALIAEGVTAPALYRMVKRVYVDVADREFRLGDGRQTDSRISILTGVHRRDVRAFRDEGAEAADPAAEKATTMTSVIGRWLASPETVDEAGRPRPLPRVGDEAGAGEGAGTVGFEDLVRAVSRDVRPRTVLDELLRQGLVAEEDGLLRLKADAVVGPADRAQKVHFFAENVGDHVAAAVENLLSDAPPFMERAVYYNRLAPASVDRIEAEANALGMEALIALNRSAAALQDQDREAPDAGERFRFGVFFYREDEAKGPRTGQETAPETDPGSRAADDDGKQKDD